VTDEEQRALELLRTKGLSIRNLPDKQREALRKFVYDIHVVRGVSLSDLAKLIGNKTGGFHQVIILKSRKTIGEW
jgi:hypothetical protein